MGRVLVAVVVVVTVVVFFSTSLGECKCEIKGIFNFGDSNTDTGGFFAAFPSERGPFGMTFFKKPVGRASDGRVIVDFLGNFTIFLKLNCLFGNDVLYVFQLKPSEYHL